VLALKGDLMSELREFPSFVAALPEVDFPFPGVRGWLLQGNEQQVVFAEFTETTEVPEHSHAEQWEIVLSGNVQLRMGGRTHEHGAGASFFIPAGVPHAATVRAGYRAIIVFNERGRYAAKR
jgi:quercetin dioxygenase-like cupin family protein